MRVGAIDCGTNSIRLLIADVVSDGNGDGRSDGAGAGAGNGMPTLRDVTRLMRVVRLGQGVDATGRLAPEALERTFAAADEYAALVRDHGVEALRFVATSATRDAANREEFTNGIRERLGVEPEVISGAEEAELSFVGATSVLGHRDDGDVLVVDLGGGSTEFVLGNAAGVTASRSMDMGCVRFTERYLPGDPPTPGEVRDARAAADAMINEAFDAVPLDTAAHVVGVAGTITTVTAHALSLPEYRPETIHGTELAVDSIADSCRDLLAMSRQERAALPYMHPGRVDVIGAGALIWQAILERAHQATDGRIRSAVASEHDILDGIALSCVPR